MTDEPPKKRNETAEQRKRRLAAELRANLVKRKAKARSQAQGEPADPVAGNEGHEGGKHD